MQKYNILYKENKITKRNIEEKNPQEKDNWNGKGKNVAVKAFAIYTGHDWGITNGYIIEAVGKKYDEKREKEEMEKGTGQKHEENMRRYQFNLTDSLWKNNIRKNRKI